MDHVARACSRHQTRADRTCRFTQVWTPVYFAMQESAGQTGFRRAGSEVSHLCERMFLALARLPSEPYASIECRLLESEDRGQQKAGPPVETSAQRIGMALHDDLGMQSRARHFAIAAPAGGLTQTSWESTK